jgi:hypothetical protein
LRDAVRPGGCNRHAQLSSNLTDARDFARAFFEALQIMDQLGHEAAAARVLDWCSGIEVARLLALSREWHAVIAAGDGGCADDATGLHWPAVLVQPWQYEQITVIELTTSAQLRAEGQVMQHCVGSYDALCRSGNSMIVSLRTPLGRPVSTAELHFDDGMPSAVAGQHRAARNAIPSTECVQALVAFVGFLNRADNRELLKRRQDFQGQQAEQDRMLRRRTGQGGLSSAAQQAARRLALG